MTRAVVVVPAVLLLVAVVLVGAAAGALAGLVGGGDTGLVPTAQALARIPPAYLAAYQQAAAGCPGLPWTVLAAIGEVESDHGRLYAPGVTRGANAAGAAGPMQLGIGQALRDHHGDLRAAVLAYNHAAWYADRVLALAASYGTPAAAAPGLAAQAAVDFAQAQLGVPYRWGGDGPGEGGFDCSGLTHAAYQAAGISLPRTAQAQYQAGPRLPPGAPLAPGDLVFFGTSPAHVTHVGMVIGLGQMIDAPHAGAFIRIEPYARSPYLGAARPANR